MQRFFCQIVMRAFAVCEKISLREKIRLDWARIG